MSQAKEKAPKDKTFEGLTLRKKSKNNKQHNEEVKTEG